jgi:UDP-N-acetylmuramyl pentapeptide phosphotransferase/UDP-N-acetylglucosamine-1-phosphate transferase
VPGIVAFAASLALTPVVLVALRRREIIDHPNERSSHVAPTIRGGGLSIALACAAGTVVAGTRVHTTGFGIVGAAFGLGVLGLAEDIWGVPTLPRFLSQVAIGGIALVWLLHEWTGAAWWCVVFGLGCIFAIAAYANAFNFMDGINGISGVQTVIAGVTWVWLGRHFSADVLVWTGAVIAGAALGFLPFNFPRAKLFIGDVGSYFIGGWQAAVVIAGLRAGVPPEAVAAPLAIYLADTGTTILKRVRAGDVWHQPHREHAYQRLIRQGWTHVATTSLVGAFVLTTCVLGSLADRGTATRVTADVALAAVVVVYLAMPTIVARNTRTATV